MNLFRGDLRRTNAVFVLCAVPLLVRVWIEAVGWRLSRGPQMVGFSLMHGGAGYWTIPLIASLLAIQIYMLWAAAVAIRSIHPVWRSEASGKRLIALGLASIWLYLYVGDSMQVELPPALLYLGALGMTVLLLGLVWLFVRSLLVPPAAPPVAEPPIAHEA